MNIYESNIINNQRNETQEIVNNRRTLSMNPEQTNIIPKYYNKHTILMDFSDKLTDDNFISTFDFSTKVSPLEYGKNQFIEQFENQKVNKKPIKPNNTFDDKKFTPFDNFDMTYGIVDKDDFTHTNMVPFTRGNGIEHNKHNAENRNFLVNLFTGSSNNHVPKKETPRFFLPEKDITFGSTMGMPVQTDFLQSRFYVSQIRQGEKPFEPTRIKPGLGQGYYSERDIGFHDPYRTLPKTIDEMRTSDRPKLSYTPPVIEGQKGQERTSQAPVIKRGPTKFKEYGDERHLPFGGAITGPKAREKYILNANARLDKKEMIGTPHHGAGNWQYIFEKKNVSSNRNAYSAFQINGPKGQNEYVSEYPMSNTFMVPEQNRETTTGLPYTGIARTEQPGKAINYNDIARRTTKETTIDDNRTGPVYNIAITAPTSNLQDKAKNTVKETIVNNKYIGGITNAYNLQPTPIQDMIKNTVKETIINNQYLGSITNMFNVQQTPIQDNIKNTIKETIIDNKYIGGVTNVYNVQQTPIQDKIKNTVKETTIDNKYIGGITNVFNTIQTPLQDQAKTTVKQTTINNYQTMGISMTDGKAPTAYIVDPAKVTVKQTTIYNQQVNGATPGQHAKPTTHLQDDARQTVKQTTINNQYLSGIKPINCELPTYIQDDIRQTVKQTTINNQYSGPLGTSEINAPQNRSAEERMSIDDRRQLLSLRKPPTNIGAFNGPEKESIQITQCKDPLLYTHMNGPYSQQVGTLDFINTKNKKDVMQIETDRINPYLVSSLYNNPLVNNNVIRRQCEDECNDTGFTSLDPLNKKAQIQNNRMIIQNENVPNEGYMMNTLSNDQNPLIINQKKC